MPHANMVIQNLVVRGEIVMDSNLKEEFINKAKNAAEAIKTYVDLYQGFSDSNPDLSQQLKALSVDSSEDHVKATLEEVERVCVSFEAVHLHMASLLEDLTMSFVYCAEMTDAERISIVAESGLYQACSEAKKTYTGPKELLKL